MVVNVFFLFSKEMFQRIFAETILKVEGKFARGNYRVFLVWWDHVGVGNGFSEVEENLIIFPNFNGCQFNFWMKNKFHGVYGSQRGGNWEFLSRLEVVRGGNFEKIKFRKKSRQFKFQMKIKFCHESWNNLIEKGWPYTSEKWRSAERCLNQLKRERPPGV